MDAEINDSPGTQYVGFNTTRKRFEPGHNLFTFPEVHSAPLNTIVPSIETTSTLEVERLTLIFTKPYIMAKAHPSSYARSYIPNTVFLWLIIQLLVIIKPAHKILSLTHRKCRGKPNTYFLLFYEE